jgi:Fic family protein
VNFVKFEIVMVDKELETLVKKYKELTSNHIINFDKFNHYAIVHHSNGIEGSTLSLDETFLLLDEQLTPKNKPLEHSLMAVDHLEALNYILSLAESKTKLTLSHIQQLSAYILKGTGSEISSMGGTFDSSKGDFRLNTVVAGVTMFPNYQKVPRLVQELLDDINKNIDNSTGYKEANYLAFVAHFQMVSIHPFADGNGRLSRLLMNYVQHYHKEPLSIIYQEDKSDYIKSLVATRKQEDPRIFAAFMFSQAKKHLKAQVKKIENKPSVKKKIRGMRFLF